MTSISQLEAKLGRCGRQTDSLRRVAATLAPDSSTIDQLISLVERSDPPTQIGATWLLKRLQSKQVRFGPVQVTRLVDQLDGSIPWESRLHIVQMLPKLSIPVSAAEELYQLLVPLLSEGNRFVRAWVCAALHALALQHNGYASEVSRLLDQASRDEAASVRARVRQLKPLNGD